MAQTLFGICEMLGVLVVSILQALAVTRTVIALESVALSFFFSITVKFKETIAGCFLPPAITMEAEVVTNISNQSCIGIIEGRGTDSREIIS